jgi:glycosyltransferase involved in cell wall biosynthesis
MEKISFIITAYNIQPSMLKACIESVLALNLDNELREILLIDDGSDSSPLPHLGSLADEIVYIRQQNQGVSGARNTGLRLATGQYIQFVDGDDQLLPAYHQCLDIAEKHRPDIIAFDMTTNKDDKQAPPETVGPMEGSQYLLKHNVHGAVWSYLFRKSALSNLLFTKGIAYGEDEEFTPQLILRADRIYTTNAKAYFYRQHPSSATHQKDEENIRKRLDDNISVILHLNKISDTLPTAEREALKRRVAQLTMDLIYNAITMTRNPEKVEQYISQLYAEGLFPLPQRDYTKKYKYFRMMTQTKTGRKILCHTLPRLKG